MVLESKHALDSHLSVASFSQQSGSKRTPDQKEGLSWMLISCPKNNVCTFWGIACIFFWEERDCLLVAKFGMG